MTRWKILEKVREVFGGKVISYDIYRQIRGIVDAILELEDPISREIEKHKEGARESD